MEVATYVELCTRLSRFVQQHRRDESAKGLAEVLDDLVAFYDRVESSDAPVKAPVHGPLVGLAAMDDLVLLSIHRLLGGFILKSSVLKLQEKAFVVFARVLRRCKPRMHGVDPGQVQRRLGFVQSCVLFLPQPPEASSGDDDTAESVTLTSQPEELRIAILQCLQELLDDRGNTPLQLGVDQQHFFAYLVAALLHVAQQDRCRDAAFRAVETLNGVMMFIRDAQTLRQYLPGVSAGLWKCANTPQQTSKVIVAALGCLANALHLCVGDQLGDVGTSSSHEKKSYTIEAIRQASRDPDTSTKDETIETSTSDTDKWLDATAVNVDLLLSRMFAAGSTAVATGTGTGLPRSSWRVRCSLAKLCGTVMLQCRKVLRISFFRCYDELLVLHVDSIKEVADASNHVLQKLQMSALSAEERLRLLPEMADRFQMLLSTLVIKVGTEHETTIVHLARTLRGYVAFLGVSLTPYFDASIESIYNALCRVVSFAALDIELVVNQALPDAAISKEEGGSTNSKVVVSQFQKRLRFFSEEASVREVMGLLHDVGSVSTPAGFIDYAFTLLTGGDSKASESGGAEIMLVLNEFLRAYCSQGDGEVSNASGKPVDAHLVGRILDDLLSLDEWGERGSDATNKALVSQRALMVECVGICAEILGANFKVFMLHVLYPLVEQLGSRSVEVERVALAALEKVYFFTNYDSLEALFQANMDYFVDALCARLEQLDDYPMTAFVVQALLRHTQLASLPLVDEVASSLLRSVDLYQDSPHVDGLLRALKYLLGSISLDAIESQTPAAANDDDENSAKPHSLLSDFINEINVLSSEGVDTLNIEDDDSTTQDPATPSDKPPSVKGAMPLEYDEDQPDSKEVDDSTPSGYCALVIDMLDRCGYFLVESDPIACCLVLSLIDEGIRFLARHRKHLLPLIARMWPEILPRLRVNNRAIVTATVQVVQTIAEIAGDFVGDRFVGSVWPGLCTQLKAIDVDPKAKASQLTRSMLLLSKPSTEISDDPDAGLPVDEQGRSPNGDELIAVNGTRKSQEIRQLLAILSCLTIVCWQSEAVTQLVPEITQICSKYLSSTAPREVVEQTTELFSALVQLNGDEVFCTIAALAEWVPPTPPTAIFPRYEIDSVRRFYRGHLTGLSGQAQLCRDNAAVLMSHLF